MDLVLAWMMALISLAETLSSFVRFCADLILVGGAARLLLPSLLRECRRNTIGALPSTKGGNMKRV